MPRSRPSARPQPGPCHPQGRGGRARRPPAPARRAIQNLPAAAQNGAAPGRAAGAAARALVGALDVLVQSAHLLLVLVHHRPDLPQPRAVSA